MIKNIFTISLILLVTACSTTNERAFQFRYQVEIEQTKGKIELWIPVPQSNEVQTISNINYDVAGFEYVLKEEKIHGNKYLYISTQNGIDSPTTIVITFNVSRKEHGNVMYDKVNPDKYLGSYAMVPTGDMFRSIINKNNLLKTNIRGVYNFVLSGMHYGKPTSVDDKYYKEPWLNAEDLYGEKQVTRDDVVELYETAENTNSDYTFGRGNSIYACDIGVGNCTDYHSYFMSLGRTLEIPVRFHMGFLIPEEEGGSISGYHCWADYYINGEGWYPIDISEADKAKKADYFFGTVCNNRVDMMVGRDFLLDGYNNGKLNLFIYPILEIDDQISSNYKKSFSYRNL